MPYSIYIYMFIQYMYIYIVWLRYKAIFITPSLLKARNGKNHISKLYTHKNYSFQQIKKRTIKVKISKKLHFSQIANGRISIFY